MKKENTTLIEKQIDMFNRDTKPAWLYELIKQKREGQNLDLPIDLENSYSEDDCDELGLRE